jgi:hypothetical protein
MTIDNKYIKEDKAFESINGLYLHRRKDGLFYKKHAKKPFTGLALTYGDEGRLICKTNFKDGLRHGLTEGFKQENGQLLFRTAFNQGNIDLSHGRELFGDGQSYWRRFVKNGITIEEECDVKGRLLKISYCEQEDGPFNPSGMYNAPIPKRLIH